MASKSKKQITRAEIKEICARDAEHGQIRLAHARGEHKDLIIIQVYSEPGYPDVYSARCELCQHSAAGEDEAEARAQLEISVSMVIEHGLPWGQTPDEMEEYLVKRGGKVIG